MKLPTFADTAAIVSQLDLLISTDTGPATWPARWRAHLAAGAARAGLALGLEWRVVRQLPQHAAVPPA